jgi:hypothetical protein
MINKILFPLFVIFFLFSTKSIADAPASQSGVEEGLELRLIKQLSRFILMSETKIRNEITNETYSQVMLGGYYRITKRLRMGLFTQAEQGLRWDTDWKDKNGIWNWEGSSNRWDYSTVLDSTYMDEITKRTTYEYKIRFFYYHSRDALQLRIRPGLRHFIFKEGKPLWQLYTAVEGYAPINYGDGLLYEFWLYGGVLYQVSKHFSLGPLVSFRQRWFRSYDAFENKGNSNFERTFSSTNIALSGVYSW